MAEALTVLNKLECSHIQLGGGVVTHADAPLNPPLKDVASDKKFFGPGGDYPNDERPVIQKAGHTWHSMILWMAALCPLSSSHPLRSLPSATSPLVCVAIGAREIREYA